MTLPILHHTLIAADLQEVDLDVLQSLLDGNSQKEAKEALNLAPGQVPKSIKRLIEGLGLPKDVRTWKAIKSPALANLQVIEDHLAQVSALEAEAAGKLAMFDF